MDDILEVVKDAIGITDDYHDKKLRNYISEVKEYMKGAGISEETVNSKTSYGTIVQGVTDIWIYGQGNLSNYFKERVIQIYYKEKR